MVGDRVRNVTFLAEWRDHDYRYSKSGKDKIAGYALLSRVAADIPIAVRTRIQIYWLDSVRADRGLRRHMIEKATTLVKGQNKNSILPGRALHERIDEAGHIICSCLDLCARLGIILTGMFIGAAGKAGIDFCNRRQIAIFHVIKKLARWDKVVSVTVRKGVHPQFGMRWKRAEL